MSVSDEVDDYPDGVEEDAPDTGEDTDNDVGPDTDVMEQVKAEGIEEKLSLAHKVGTEKQFTELGKRDTVVFDTPIEGMKTGEIVERTESWSGVLSVKVDTGAREYTLTPFEDGFSAKYVGTVDNTLELSQSVLERLEAATIEDVEKGDRVVLDCSKVGPTVTTTTDVVESKNQGLRGTFKAADGHYFVVYEQPSPLQTKEQPYIVGRER